MNRAHPQPADEPNAAERPADPTQPPQDSVRVATDASSASSDAATALVDGLTIDTPESVREYALAEARKAVERGWAFTQLEGKRPKRAGWQKAPKPDFETVRAWISVGNIGLRTGAVSGVVVVDDDSEDGSASAALDLPPTVTAVTGSGKQHFLFKSPGFKVGNATGNLPDGIDMRGDGGQVVFVGSIHPKTQRAYRWAPGPSPDEIEIADLPDNVVALIHAPKAKKSAGHREKKRSSTSIGESASRALAGAAEAIATSSEGARNTALNREAFRMGRWINSGHVTRADVEAALTSAARTSGLGDREIAATLSSGLNAGCSQLVPFDGPVELRSAPKVRPSITLEGGKLPELVTAAEDALIHAEVPIFQRGGSLVRTVRAPALTLRDIYRRAEGVLMLLPIEVPNLVEILTRVANWYTHTREDLLAVDCPERIARTYLARVGQWRLRRLLGVIEAPTLRPDGTVIETPGYDQTTCLWFDPGGVVFPKIPVEPTREDALKSLAVLLRVVKDFPFVAESDRSAALAAILTSLIRHSLRAAPLFAMRAPKMGSGKSLLADIIGLIATGRVCSVMSQGKDEDEDKKRLLAILVEGVAVACIDNIERPFGSAALCTVLTQEVWRDRILGSTATATVPTNVTWLATGNNITFVGDIVTRVVPCDLDANVERPEERSFNVNLHEYVPSNRAALVAAGLTILRAFRVAGSPDQGLSVFGRFEEWSDWVRSALVWLGLEDPCAGRQRLYSQDPVGSGLRALLGAWYAVVGERPVSAAELIKLASVGEREGQTEGVSIDMAGGKGGSALHTALVGVAAGSGGRPDGRRLGNFLAKYARRAEGGLRVERFDERQGVARWRVARVDLAAPGGFVGLVGRSPEIQEPSASEGTSGEVRRDVGCTSEVALEAVLVKSSSCPPEPKGSGLQKQSFTEYPDVPMDPEARRTSLRRTTAAGGEA